MKVVLISLALFSVGFIACLQIIPERATLEYFSTKYVENASVYIKRYGRNSPYFFNIIGRNKHTWDNNVSINLVFYEYLHNEYRRSFVELHFKLCDMLNSDPYVGAMVANAGITCPVYPKMQYMVNMSIPAADFKYTIPFKKVMAEVYFSITATGEVIARGNFYLHFSDKKKLI